MENITLGHLKMFVGFDGESIKKTWNVTGTIILIFKMRGINMGKIILVG
jgi:hypothetical protein